MEAKTNGKTMQVQEMNPGAVFEAARRAAQECERQREVEKAEREARERQKERERLIEMIERRLDIDRSALQWEEDDDGVYFGDLYFFKTTDKTFGDRQLIAIRPDPESEKHRLCSYNIRSRADLGDFLDGHIEDRFLTEEAYKEEEEEQPDPTPKHEKEADAPARPVLTSNQHGDVFTNKSDRGLTKREYFAAMALQGLSANEPLTGVIADQKSGDYSHKLAEIAVKHADALLKALYPQSTDGAGGQTDD